MAISLDATSTANNSSVDGTHAWNHTVGTAKGNVALFVGVALRGDSATPGTISATYAGTAMTKVGEFTNTTEYLLVALFYLLRPATGVNSVSLSWTNGAIGGGYGISLYDVSSSSPVRSGSYTTLARTNSATPSIAVPSSVGDWVLDVLSSESPFGGSVGLTVGAGQTQVMNAEVQVSNRVAFGGSYEAGASPTVSMSWSKSSGYYGIMAGLSVQPAAGGSNVVVSPSFIL